MAPPPAVTPNSSNPLWSGYGRRELRSPSAESVFYEWLGDAAHPAFRTLAAAWC
ncbi:MAG: hypothetical protein ACYDCW_11705 [Acidithiobacillus ferrivorans]